MTIARMFGEGTAFSEWLRAQNSLDSYKGYRTTNLDFVWCKFADNAKSEIIAYMMIEEKTRGGFLKSNQVAIYRKLAKNCLGDPEYKGCYLLQFQNETPEDGEIRISDISKSQPMKKITKESLVGFLSFELSYQELI